MAALSSGMRRLASSMAPIALKTLGSQRYYRPLALAAKIIHSHSLPPRLHFSSASDKSLLRVIDEEIESARDSEEHSLVDELPAGFPFEIEDNPGHRTVTLKRRYQDEDIGVVVHMSSLISGGENQIEDDDDDEDSEKALQSSVPLVVSVSKKSGDSSLEFLCMAYVDEIVIESLTVKKTESSGDQASVYEGPDYSELDENLVKSFQKYLEIRGIKASTLSFLHEYMIDKDSKEYLAWLQKVKKFIAA